MSTDALNEVDTPTHEKNSGAIIREHLVAAIASDIAFLLRPLVAQPCRVREDGHHANGYQPHQPCLDLARLAISTLAAKRVAEMRGLTLSAK